MTCAGQSVLITGCSPGGIGEALAKQFKSRGFQVIATGRTVSKISNLEEFGIECVSLTVDNPRSVTECHEKVKQLLKGKGLDFLINNAGKTINRPAAETNLGEMKDIFSVNVFAVIDITQTFLPELIAAKGTIVNIGSVVGHMPIPYSAVYCGSKAALYAYSESLRLEVAPLGVKVTYIQTANVKTNIFRGRTTLNDNSLWIEAREAFDHTQEQAATTGMEPEAYAKSLTSQLVSGHRNVRWVGEGAFMVWFMLELQKFLPFQIITPLLTKLYGLDKVERPKDKDV